MDGLIVKPKWGKLILYGCKTWEIRGSNTAHRGRHYLMYSGTGKIYGEFELLDSQPFTEEDFHKHMDKHRLPIEFLWESDILQRYKKPYKWIIGHVKMYETPIPYFHPQGAVIWVKDVKLCGNIEERSDAVS